MTSPAAFDRFHSLVRDWFVGAFERPTPPQELGWPAIAAGRHTLLCAPTGTGKTLAAFLWAIDGLVRAAMSGTLEDRTLVVYVSPLKALSNDIQKNLWEPLRAIRRMAEERGIPLPEIRVAVRTGDTPPGERQSMRRRPPHILITTPESLYILLTVESSRRYLARARTVIVDEIHAVAPDKRGAHLALSLERLDDLAGAPLQRIGLSATQRPIEEIGRLLVGTRNLTPGGMPDCAIVDVGHGRTLDLRVEVPDQPLGPVASHAMWAEVYDRIAAYAKEVRTTIVFVNTRKFVERVAYQLSQRMGKDAVAAHHGSLSRDTRLKAEQGLKAGSLKIVVATASLELGIDIGHVDLVCHLGAPRSLAVLLQRVGRSGHWLGATPRGILFPGTRDELVQCAAAVRAVRAGGLDRVTIPKAPRDILAQQIVATVASEERTEQGMLALARRAYPYRDLGREEYEAILTILAEGVSTKRGRRSAHLHWDRVNRRLRGRRGALLTAITCGGTIPDVADYRVIEDPAGTFVGTVNEDFAVESVTGDIFLLGNRSWRIRKIESGKVRVEDAQGAPPTIPFWLGEAPGRTMELSAAVAEVREQVAARLPDIPAAVAWLCSECGADRPAAEQIVAYVVETLAILGTVPTQKTVVAERFFDEAGGMQLVLHAPFGNRINRAWGLALRKRFCLTFDFELQAAATDDGIVLSLGEQHSFALESVFAMVRPGALRDDLVQAVLQAPMFGTRWRWNATRGLALLRARGGRRVPMPLQRMQADDLLAAVFPDQVACQDNHAGPITPPDHPLVNETMDNCFTEAMDIEGLRAVIANLERGELRTVAVETPVPSPMSHEILNANPYAFLDDAPLEERRARAVSLRRVDVNLAGGVGALDQAAIDEVKSQAWPDVRDADELHDALLSLVLLPAGELGDWRGWMEELIAANRACRVSWNLEPRAASRESRADPPTLSLPRRRGEGREGVPSAERRATGPVEKSIGQEVNWERPNQSLDESTHRPIDQLTETEPRAASREEARATSEGYVAAERREWARAALPNVEFETETPALAGGGAAGAVTEEEGVRRIVQGWMEAVGPITAAALAERLGLSPRTVEGALLALEAGGVVLRGRFTPGVEAGTTEWCERRLLARIHRLTIGRLRREIEPVAAADLLRFLFRWQHIHPGSQLHGRDGIVSVIGQLQGMELPAPAWEREVLPARIARYSGADLEQLCLSGVVAWGRLRLREEAADDEEAPRRRQGFTRSASLGLVLRERLPDLLEAGPVGPEMMSGLSSGARAVVRHLQARGASFLIEIAKATGHLESQVEEALWELVARGLVTGDGIAGLRLLLTSGEAKREPHRRFRAIRGGLGRARHVPVGRWSLLREPDEAGGGQTSPPDADEAFARQLLRRYGVVLRELLARETRAPAWRTLLGIYRKLEARGEIRGGRFVDGFGGEQFALPEAVETLRAIRRRREGDEMVLVAASDPLNLVGILTPGSRVSSLSGQAILYVNGVPVEIGERHVLQATARRRSHMLSQ
jgi:ATP-dependent Lhr-like helicase